MRYSVKISVIMMFFCSGKFAETLMTNNQKLYHINVLRSKVGGDGGGEI